MKHSNSAKTLVACALALCISSVATRDSYAQAVIPLQISPARQELQANPGESVSFNVRIYNNDNTPIHGSVHINDFIVKSNGKPVFIEDPAQASPKYSASQWVKNPYDTLSIPAKERDVLQLKMTIPKDARPGGRYIAVYFEPSSPIPAATGLSATQQAGSAVAPRIVSLVYVRINGQINEDASIIRFFAPFFQEYGPISVTTSILNNGDYHISPRGVLSVQNMFGSSVQQTLLKEQNIFPESSNDYTTLVGKKWMLGRYKINLAASYGEQGKALSRALYIWVFPWKLALVLLLGILFVLLAISYIGRTMSQRQKELESRIQEEKQQIDILKEKLKNRN